MPRHLDYLNSKLADAAAGDIRRLIITCPPRHGKPLYNGSMILLQDGSRKPLGDIRRGDVVITHLGRGRRVQEIHEQGLLQCVRITTRSGRQAIAALDHPFLTPSGWLKARYLRSGMALANVSRPNCGSEVANAETFRLAGYFVGDGKTVVGTTTCGAEITCLDDLLRADIRECAVAAGFAVGRETAKTIPLIQGVRDWLRTIGLAGCGSHTKRVPAFVFQGTRGLIGNFIGAYFACDGHINKKGNARRDACVEIYSVNRPLLGDVQHLLLRLGIQSRIATKNSKYNNYIKGPHASYRLTISSQDDVARYVERVPVFGKKMAALQEWGVVRQRFDEQYLSDEIVSVESAGEQPCRCLTIKEDHTFTSDDFVVHNSELTSRYFPAWYLGTFPDRRVILASYEADFAATWGRKAREILEEHGSLFGVKVRPDSSAANRWDLAGYEGGMMTAGAGGPITGKGAHLLIIDDPVKNAEEAMSKSFREKCWDWFTSTAYTRLEPDGVCVLIQTRWVVDDLAGRLLEAAQNGGEHWELVNLPALAEENDALGRQPGEPLWPERYNEERLLEIQRAVGSFWWNALYQQRPVPEGGAHFKREWFDGKTFTHFNDRWYAKGRNPAGWQRSDCRLLCTVDLAASEKTSADYTVFGAFLVTPDNDILILDIVRQRFAIDRIVPELLVFAQKWKPEYIGVEADGFQYAIASQAMKTAGMPPVQGLKTAGKGKLTRATPAIVRAQAGQIFLPAKAAWIDPFLAELTAFTGVPGQDAHDDQCDALAWGVICAGGSTFVAPAQPAAPPLDPKRIYERPAPGRSPTDRLFGRRR